LCDGCTLISEIGLLLYLSAAPLYKRLAIEYNSRQLNQKTIARRSERLIKNAVNLFASPVLSNSLSLLHFVACIQRAERRVVQRLVAITVTILQYLVHLIRTKYKYLYGTEDKMTTCLTFGS